MGIGVPPHLDGHPHPVPVGFVPDIGDPFHLLFFHQVGDSFQELGLVDLIGELRDNDPFPVLPRLLDEAPGPDLDHAPAGFVGFANPLGGQDKARSRKIRPWNDLYQIIQTAFRTVDEPHDGITHFPKVVGRYVGGHAHGNARGAVHQEIRDRGGKDEGLQHGAVIVGCKIHGFFFDVVQKILSQPCHPHFGVSHGCRRIAVHGAEVALAVHKGIAHGEVLGESYDRVIHRRIPVGMVFSDHVPHNAGRFFVGPVKGVPHLVHGKEDPAMNGLEPVADVGQGPSNNDAHGIFEIGLLHLVFDIDTVEYEILNHRSSP